LLAGLSGDQPLEPMRRLVGTQQRAAVGRLEAGDGFHRHD